MIRSVVRGFGAALPKRIVTNQELESKVDTSDEWIVQRTASASATSPAKAKPRRRLARPLHAQHWTMPG